jgi:S-adenosylmethionine:tRNA-ribosyltransferase-isomerase (queuine synthetase)
VPSSLTHSREEVCTTTLIQLYQDVRCTSFGTKLNHFPKSTLLQLVPLLGTTENLRNIFHSPISN